MKKLFALLIILTLLLQAGTVFAPEAETGGLALPLATEAEPIETGSTEPVETEPVETEPVETEPMETEAVETEPVETEPIETEPVETEPIETEPAETEPIETEPTEPEELWPRETEHKLYIRGSKGAFNPNQSLTRAELAQILYNLDSYPKGEAIFPDVAAKAWYAKAVNALAATGLVKGYSDGSFRPGNAITRAELVTILARKSGLKWKQGTDFPDAARHWARNSIGLAAEQGWVNGYKDGSFRPNAPVTRAEAVTMVNRFLGRAPDKAEIARCGWINPFYDVAPGSWYYYNVMEAAVAHTALYDSAEARERWSPLPQPEAAADFAEKLQYGVSGSGKYPLEAWKLGSGENVMVLSFAIHGWEDNFAHDGQELVFLADQVKEYLCAYPNLVTGRDWTVYILRCLNPDGTYEGYSHNGPGRCTTTWLDAHGVLHRDRGVDMNRCFPYNYQSYSSARNFNGTAPLQAVEAQALAKFVQQIKGSGYNICIDTHGWFSQIITTAGRGALFNAFARQFPQNEYTYMSKGHGYFTAWTGYSLNFDSCLLELPRSVMSHSDFLSSDCVGKFERAITELLQSYSGSGAARRAPGPEEMPRQASEE